MVEVRTDGDGVFAAVGLPVGEVPVFVESHERAPWSGVVTTKRDGVSSLQVVQPPGAGVHGRVRTGDGAPVSAGLVQSVSRAWHLRASTTIAADGSYELGGLPAGRLEIEAMSEEGGRYEVKEIVAVAGDLVEVDFGPGCRIAGGSRPVRGRSQGHGNRRPRTR